MLSGRGNKTPERAKNTGATLRRLWGYIARHKGLALAALALSLIGNLLALVGPWLSGRAINAINPGAGAVDFGQVFLYCALMAVFYIASSVLGYIVSALMIKLSQSVISRLRREVQSRLLDLPVGYFDRHQTGDIVSHISYDIDTLASSLSNDLIQVVASVVTVIGSLVMMLLISPPLVVVFAVTIPLSVLFTRYMSRKVRPLFRKRSKALGELNGYAEEVISGLKTVKAYRSEAVFTERFEEKNAEAAEAYYRAEYFGSITGPAVNFINNLSLSFISVLGAALYLLGRMMLGDLSSFVLYSRKFSGPINEVANIVSELQSAAAAAERVFRILDEQPEKPDAPGAEEAGAVKGHVRVENVTFGYVPGRTIVKNFSMDAVPGSLIAIVGQTGAGKTTLINLLMRFYDPDSGVIRLDGRDISSLTRRSLRRSYAMVLQDTWLFRGTVAENIAYGSKKATREQIISAAKAAMVHSFITGLPKGYDTVLDEEGQGVSQGQKQLLTIARAMLTDAHMLILDEATSSVDTRTERLISDAMRRLMRDKTCFVIAHRLSTIQGADRILVVSDGEIAEQGSHAELMASGGIYAGLYAAQFE